MLIISMSIRKNINKALFANTKTAAPPNMVKRDHFSKLASDNAKERVQAANALMQELIEEDSAQEWDYTYNRLIKGLTSTRQTAKLGFGMLLTEIVLEMRKRGDLNLEKYLDKLIEVTTIKGGMKGKEERALLFGRLFGLNVVIKVGWLKEASEAEWLHFIGVLTDLLDTKPWIREATASSLIDAIKSANEKIANTIHLQVLQKVNDLGLNLSTEGLAIYLAIDRVTRSKLASEIVKPKTNWKNGDPLHKGNLPVLAKVLKDVEIVDENSEDRKQKSNWTPNLPFVWNILIDDFVHCNDKVQEPPQKKQKKSNSSKTEDDIIGLKVFYKVVVDESLFSEKSSHERKYWGFEIFMNFLAKLDHDLDVLFTPNFMRCLINQSSHKSRTLHNIVVKVLSAISDKGSHSNDTAPVLLSCLLDESRGGCWNFDLITKSRTIDGILSALNIGNIPVIVAKFTEMLKSQSTTDGFKYSNDNVLKWCLDKLVHLVKFNKEDNIVKQIIGLLIKCAFFESDASPNIRKMAQEKLNAVLSEVLSRSGESGITWPRYCVEQIALLEKTSKCLVEFDEELGKVRDETSAILRSVSTSSKGDFDNVFGLLFSMCFIQLYMGDEEIVQITQELISLYQKEVDKTEDNVDTALVMTEVLLSFITRKSTLLKKLSMIVWDHFLCGTDEEGQLRINDECFELLFDVLKTKENKEGQKQLFENDDEMVVDGEDEEGDEDDDEDGDNDSEDGNNDSEDGDNDLDDGDNDSEDGDNDSDDDSNNETANNTMTDLDKETNLKLAKALGIPTAESGEVKFDELSDLDSSNDEYESDSMDDEQMMAMDDQLSKIFKERQDILNSVSSGNKRKTEVHEARENMIFFKNRVLDLLESFTKHHPNAEYNLKFIGPVVTLINLTMDKSLGVKAHKFLKTRISKTKVYSATGPTSIQDVPEFTQWCKQLIEKLQDQAATTKSSNHAVIASYNQSCIILAKNLIGVDSSQLEPIIDIYTNALKKWALNKNNKLQVSLFFDFINWLNDKRHNLSGQ